MASHEALLLYLLLLQLACLTVPRCRALRDVELVMPPVARAGSSVTLRCLYDLENAKLYAVKWYRGNFEFYRATPHESPSKQAFPYPDFNVDLALSDEHQVTLRRVPLHMSGTFACEVSTDAPAFTTSIKSGQLQVLDTVRRPLLTVSKDLYRPGDELEANCTSPSNALSEPSGSNPTAMRARGNPLLPLPPPLQPHQLTPQQRTHLQQDTSGQPAMSFGFWVNNRPVPSTLVLQRPNSATLRRPLTDADFSAAGELRLKCVVTLADKYREPSHVVTVRRQDDADDEEDEEDEDEGALEEEEDEDVVSTEHALNVAHLPDPADRTNAAGSAAGHKSIVPASAILMSILMTFWTGAVPR